MPTCQGTELVVSGAGARLYDFFGQNPTHFQSSDYGFFYVAIEGNTLKGEIIKHDGTVEFTRTLTKP